MTYSRTLVEHFRHPRNTGLMPDPDATGAGEYEGCGDLTRVFLRVRDGRVAQVRVQTYGCGPAIAAASAGSELVSGRLVGDLRDFPATAVDAAVGGLPPERRHAADLVAAAIRAAARDWMSRHA
jgi:nitrogen fixation NifU-like protein